MADSLYNPISAEHAGCAYVLLLFHETKSVPPLYEPILLPWHAFKVKQMHK